MTMLDTPRYGSSYAKKVGQANPEDLLRTIREEQPSLSPKREREAFRQAVLADPEMIDACINWVLTNAGRNISKVQETPITPELAEQQYQERKKQTAETAKKAEQVVHHAMLSIVRRMTFGEVAHLAKVGPKFAKLGKPSQVIGDVLSDEKIDKILKSK